jgi:uncharacterized membrane protein
MQFLFPTLLWGFLLVGIPVLIQLITLLRHRRRQWAAMEFLLESYRRNRRWVWLKQLLLLASRMAIMAVLVLLLAQWISGSRWLSLFGQRVTHHYVLLDDSLSMSDVGGGTGSAYQRGLRAISGLLARAAQSGGPHQVTVLRYSRAALASRSAGDDPAATLPAPRSGGAAPSARSGTSGGESPRSGSADIVADLLARSLPSDPQPLLERLAGTSPTPMELSPRAALELVEQLVGAATTETPLVYLVSDFRRTQWDRPEEIRTALEALTKLGARLELIDCVETEHVNLGLGLLEPQQDVLAAGVPVMMQLEVHNHSPLPARNVNVRLRAINYSGPPAEPLQQQTYSGQVSELPTLVLEEIPPGESVRRLFQTVFPTPGWHALEARLADDAVAADNQRTAAFEIVSTQRVLLVSGPSDRLQPFFLTAAAQPGGGTNTGFSIDQRDPSYLRQANLDELSGYAAIVLTDLQLLDRQTLATLRQYVEQGGGLSLFFGPSFDRQDLTTYNELWYQDGEGLLPFPLQSVVELAPSRDPAAADIIAQSHPILEPLLGAGVNPLQLIRLSRFMQQRESVGLGSAAGSDLGSGPASWQLVAKTRTGQPLVVDHAIGRGRVVTWLTSLEPQWSNWAQDPTFVVAALRLVGYLGSFRQQQFSRPAGEPLVQTYAAGGLLPELQVMLPATTSGQLRLPMEVPAVTSPDDRLLRLELAADPSQQSEEVIRSLVWPGITEIWSQGIQGDRQLRLSSRHVLPEAGDLSKLSSQQLQQNLRGVPVRYRTAEAMSSPLLAGFGQSSFVLLTLLVLLLMFEQWLGWLCSYHLPSSGRSGGAGNG